METTAERPSAQYLAEHADELADITILAIIAAVVQVPFTVFGLVKLALWLL